MRISVRRAVFLLLAAAVTTVLVSCSREPDGKRPHVLLITLDTMRADRLGCYGYDRPTSPNLDALARESFVFDLAVAQAAVTPVSHASILTGLEPFRHGLRVMHGLVENRLEEKWTTLAEVWRESGGQSAAFVSAFPVTAAFGLDQGFGCFNANFPKSSGQGLVTLDGVVNTGMSQRRADWTTRAAVAWLEDEHDPGSPLFMWVHYFDPHDPLVAPPREMMQDLMNGNFKPPTEETSDRLRSIYDCDVYFMDMQIGLLLEEFRKRGLWENTVVAVVADHGEGLGDHDWWSHGILYQEQIRVPMLVRLPHEGANGRVTSLVRTIDLMPTLLEAAGIEKNLRPPMDGVSLVNVMKTGRAGDPLPAYSESVNILNYGRPDIAGGRDNKDDKLYCLVEGNHKLIYHQLEPEKNEFYDLSTDPGELHNLASRSPEPMAEMIRRLEEMDVFSDIMPGMTPTDLERTRQLRNLGYIQ